MKYNNDIIALKASAARVIRTLAAAAALAVSIGGAAPALAASDVATSAQAYTCQTYVVRRGDALYALADRFGISATVLQTVNKLRSTRLYIGQRLCIPHYYTPRPPPPPGGGPGVPPPSSGGPWYGEYWNNTAQSGAPSMVRNDADINFNWGFGTPDAGRIFADNFSARWTRTIQSQGGVYRFGFNVDDGIRLYVDGQLVFDQFNFTGDLTQAVEVTLAPGARTVRVDYVERGGLAKIRFNYIRASGGGPTVPPPVTTAWYGEFFKNRDLSGSPVFVGSYPAVSFNWGTGAPAANVPADNFSARFTKIQSFGAGTYRFVAQSDDGVRVFVDDKLVINEWREQSYRTFVGDIALSAGNHTVRVEYFEAALQAAVRVYWEQR